mmetsp:Transcript_24335/g.52352  ORF Transcript_24335/g.52352 Transcript_24335/m.52352 type:complete len:221 (-) Transcript_24335:191-853(-)
MTAAPHPSPKSTQVLRSLQSTKRESASAPITSTFLYVPQRTYWDPVMRATTKPLQALVMSKQAAREAPILACTWQAEPKMSSAVEVASRMRSTSSAWRPAWSRARSAAALACVLSASPSASTRRSLMPVRVEIHSSFVSTICSRSPFVSSLPGVELPHPTTFTPCTHGAPPPALLSGCAFAPLPPFPCVAFLMVAVVTVVAVELPLPPLLLLLLHAVTCL